MDFVLLSPSIVKIDTKRGGNDRGGVEWVELSKWRLRVWKELNLKIKTEKFMFNLKVTLKWQNCLPDFRIFDPEIGISYLKNL